VFYAQTTLKKLSFTSSSNALLANGAGDLSTFPRTLLYLLRTCSSEREDNLDQGFLGKLS
jgi:hypothetical protein